MVVYTKKVNLKDLKREIIAVINKEKNNIFKDKVIAERFAKRLAEFTARSYRSNVSFAPYNYRSNKAGQWSRGGGRPLEKSIRVINEKNKYTVAIENSGKSNLKGAVAPTQYYSYGAIVHLKKTMATVKANKNKILYEILLNKR